jgi:hypothetical protein
MSSFLIHSEAQDLLKLSAEVLSAADDLDNSLDNLEKMRNAIKDIENHKTPNIAQNEWGELANQYRKAAQTIDAAPLPTEFDSEKYIVSLNDMMDCQLKEQNVKKMEAYLQELKGGQERGRESIIKLNEIDRKIKISKEVLKYCIDVHEKLSQTPIFGQKFLFDWLELDTDVTDALNTFETSIRDQRKKITSEKAKLDLYVPNFEANFSELKKYLSTHCNAIASKDSILSPRKNNDKAIQVTKEERTTGNAFYVFLTTDLMINGKSLTIISAPILHNGTLTDAMTDDKEDFVKQIERQLSNTTENIRQKLTRDNYGAISVHYAKPYSTSLLRSVSEGLDAIEAFKQSIRSAVAGLPHADQIDFLQLK